jgi:hypothetical protein
VIVLPAFAVQQVVTAVVTALAVFLGGLCFQACSQEPGVFLVSAAPYSSAVEQETGDLHLMAVHCFLAAPYFRDGFQ